MHTDDSLRPLPAECDKLETGFGKNILARVLLTFVRHDDEVELEQAIQQDLAIAGPQGVLSLLRALIELVALTRDELLEFGSAICGPPTAKLFEELLDEFEGDKPRRDLWKRTPDGTYRLSYRH